MCGSVVAASSLNKHLVCALGPAAARTSAAYKAYSTVTRRMVLDMGSSRSIRIIEFSWMADGALIVIVKVLIAPDPLRPFDQAGCSGTFAVFDDAIPGGPLPVIPRSLVSFLEAPRCPVCIQTGSLGCYCLKKPSTVDPPSSSHPHLSSAAWPPQIENDLSNAPVSCADTYDNVRLRLRTIHHIAHVKVTAHIVSTSNSVDAFGQPCTTYRLGPSHFVIRDVHFRTANVMETHTLRQAAAKLRLLRGGVLRIASALGARAFTDHVNAQLPSQSSSICVNDVGDFDTQGDDTLQHEAPPVSEDEEVAISGAIPSEEQCNVMGPKTMDALSMITNSYATGVATDGPLGDSPIDEWDLNVGNVISDCDRDSEIVVRRPYAQESGVRLSCPKCDKTFSQQGSLNRHLKNIHEQSKIPCEYCTMTFGQMFDLKVSLMRFFLECDFDMS